MKSLLKTQITANNSKIKSLEKSIIDFRDRDLPNCEEQVNEVIEYLKDFSSLYKKLDRESKIEYLRTIVDRVIFDGSEVFFVFKSPSTFCWKI